MFAQIFERAKNILISPAKEWPKIAKEDNDIAKLLVGWVLPLTAITVICMLLGWTLLAIFKGLPVGDVLVYGILSGIVTAILYVVLLILVALFANILAPSFGGKDDLGKAFGLVSYSATPLFLAGILYLLVAVLPLQSLKLPGLLALVALLYGMYLLYLGVNPMKGVARDKALVYFIVVCLIYVVLYFVLVYVLAPVILASLTSMGKMMMFL
jgi:hypothetical protein